MPGELKAKVDADSAMRAFDSLATDGPRVVHNTLRSLADEAKRRAQAKAPGGLKRGWRVSPLADPSTGDEFGVGVATPDQLLYERRYARRKNQRSLEGDGVLRVARWANYGTGDKADGRVIRDGNRSFKGQKPQRFLRPVPKARQQRECQEALVRTARKIGFTEGHGL